MLKARHGVRFPPFTNTIWRLGAFGSVYHPTPAIVSANATLTFSIHGGFIGSTGCNHLRGTYTLEDSTLVCALFLPTHRTCPTEELESQDHTVLLALGAPMRCELNDTQLVLSYGEAAALIFRAD